jgi:hypothetical protein
MISANVWERVVHVRCGAVAGTGFTIDHDGHQYLVTARHVVASGEEVEVRVRGNAVPVGLDRLTVPVVDADVAVFKMDHAITPGLPLPASMEGMVYGQDAYFLGYPLGFTFNIGPTEYFPLVKRATVSGTNHGLVGRAVLLLDGWNNPGFSGGPVVFRPPSGRGVDEPWRVAGVIRGYWQQPGSISVGGQVLQGAEVLMNSGIIIAEEIARAGEAIQAAP